jgi:transposase
VLVIDSHNGIMISFGMGSSGRKTKVVELDEADRLELSRRANSHTVASRDKLRAEIILLKAHGKTQQQVSDELGIARRTVMKWTNRFLECRLEGLRDAPGRGRKPTVSPEINNQIITRVTQPPENMSRWSTRTMAKELGVSNSHVSKVWRANGIKPHLVRTFKLSKDPNFEEKFWDVIGLYLDPPEKAIVFCCDEKSQCQALERSQPGLPLGSGYIKTRTHDYYRHGTTTLFAALNYLDGSLISMTEKRHRHEEWLKFLKQIDSEISADVDLHLIIDNYSTHKHQNVKDWLMNHPRFHIHFTPTGSSWMNMVERFFADITEDVIREGSFQNLKELESAINDYMAARNRKPKRYVWKAEGQKILEKINRARRKLSWNQYCEPISNSGH